MPIDPNTGEDLSRLGDIDPYERGLHDPHPIEPPRPPPINNPAPPPPQPTREVSSTTPAPVTWIFVRSGNSFPGNHPNYDDLKAHGVGGILIDIDDPYRDWMAQTARDAGLRVGVWSDPHGMDANAYAARLAAGAAAVNAEMAAVDLEFAGKGFPGSPQWDYNAAVAQAVRGALPSTPLAVSPPPLTGVPTDYNFAAWVKANAAVWMQIYGPNNEVVASPETIQWVLSQNHVPPELATMVLPAGSLADTIPQANRIGLPYWALWTADDISEGDRSIPFGTPSAGPVSSPYNPGADLPIPLSDTDGSYDYPSDIGDESLVPIEDTGVDAVDVAQVDDTEWEIDPSVYIQESEVSDEGLRFLSGVTPNPSTHYPDWCLIAVGGYVQGKNGPISAGLRQLELIVGLSNVFVDYAPTGHAPHSYHKCGLAADIRPLLTLWNLLFPARQEWLELFGPWGLYKRGEKFIDPPLQADHEDHIHIALNKTADGVSTLLPKLPDGRLHVPGGSAPAPIVQVSKPINLADVNKAWHTLMTRMDDGRRASAQRTRTIANSYLQVLK